MATRKVTAPYVEKSCLICHKPASTTFFCPCDLHHGLCPDHVTIERQDCAYAHLYKAGSTFQVGDRVICNGYEGAIGRLETGVLDGMATVRLERGQVCVDLKELRRA